jgi:hypothetical protein
MNQEFNMDPLERSAKKLVESMSNEKTGKLIKALVANAVGTTTFDYAAPSGTSQYAHVRTLKFKLEEAAAVITANAKMGDISVIIAGNKAAAQYANTPGFTRMANGRSQGAHLFGTLDGIPIIKVIDTAILATATSICLYKGDVPWEGAAYVATLFPLITTGVQGTGTNPLAQQQAVAFFGEVGVLNANLATTLTMSNLP